MTCPFRKKVEKTLVGVQPVRMILSEALLEVGGTANAYGFVNMMSDAPSVQRVKWECKYVRAGRIPHVSGSSSL